MSRRLVLVRSAAIAGLIAASMILATDRAGAQGAQGAGCSVSATSVAFGSYDPFGASPLDSQGTITYGCSGFTRLPRLVLQIGNGISSSFSRYMISFGDTLNYNLYLDAARQTVWGDGSGGTIVLTHNSPRNGTNYTVTVYGRIPARQDAKPGLYGDSLVVTLLW
jgi:spore coat protein U-like protein